MPVSQKKIVVSKFPLRLMPSVRRIAESFSEKEGVSLNQFINVAVAEKLAHLQHEEWLSHRPKVSDALISKALEALDRRTGHSRDEFDKIPAGYEPVGRRISARRRSGRRRS